MSFSAKLKTFSQFLAKFVQSTSNLGHFEINMSLIADLFLKF